MKAAAVVRVLLGDVSAVVRRGIDELLRGANNITVVGVVAPRDDIVSQIKRLRPNLVLLGAGPAISDPFETIKRVMAEAPAPIVLVADGEGGDVQAELQALRSGALAVLPLPNGAGTAAGDAARTRFVASLRAMSEVKLVRRWRETSAPGEAPTSSALPRPGLDCLVAIAASTGGPAALQRVLSELPPHFPAPILVVQHIADGFTDGLAQWLDTMCSLTVKVAAQGEPLRPRTVYLAADGHHLGVSPRSTIVLSGTPPIDGFRPAADYLFDSAARGFGAGLTAAVLTGMGQDGVAGLRAVRQFGGEVIAQDEMSSVVYGMPKAAYDAGLVDHVLPLSSIASRLIERVEATCDGDSR
jgi:two-component system chemotaxis response regulator CheB